MRWFEMIASRRTKEIGPLSKYKTGGYYNIDAGSGNLINLAFQRPFPKEISSDSSGNDEHFAHLPFQDKIHTLILCQTNRHNAFDLNNIYPSSSL